MKKTKIAVWGITDAIWSSVLNNIDFRKCEICFFIDNNPYSEGVIYEGRPIYHFDEMAIEKLQSMDVVLIAAYSGYQKIYQSLSKVISEEKIQLYITKGLLAYNIGKLHGDNKSNISKIYIHPDEAEAYVNSYEKMEAEYAKNPSVLEDATRWFHRSHFISHACGGMCKGRKMMYTNSLEALEYSLEKDFP